MNITAIGVSTGGPGALRELFASLPRLETCVLLVQHMPRFINASVCRSIQALTDMEVVLGDDGVPLAHGRIIVAPSECHMCVLDNRRIRLEHSEKVNYVCPAADKTMMSLRAKRNDHFVGIIMTGLGRDGADGIRHIKTIGGLTLAQDEQTSTIYGMPKAAVETGCVDYEGSPTAMHLKLVELFAESSPRKSSELNGRHRADVAASASPEMLS
jgi:two-component system chemotaxis response regulator CheB